MTLTPADHDRVTAAVTAAEAATDAEIVAIVAPRSDAYHDVALHWALLAALLALATIAAFPDCAVAWLDTLRGGWSHDWSHRELLTVLLVIVVLKFLVARLILAWTPLRLAFTPAATKARRVRRRAVDAFRIGAERRTVARNGVLLYVSLAERRAEIVTDAAVLAATTPETWGEAMATLVDALQDGRPGDGIADAVTRIGAVLSRHFPRTGSDPNELPDRLIEL